MSTVNSRTLRAAKLSNAKVVTPLEPAMAEASGLLQTLQGHVEDIRALIQCGICVRPLYEPYTLGCGHTFCYGCLTSWFGSGRSHKTCPDCRAHVKNQPAPAYLVRTLVQLFTGHAELLEGGETTAEHSKHQREEAERLEADKSNTNPQTGGLFQGCFKEKRPFGGPIFDLDDGVARCPHCAWEIEDEICVHCGMHVEDDTVTGTDFSEDNSEMTDDDDVLDEMDDDFGDMDEPEYYEYHAFREFPFWSLDGHDYRPEIFDPALDRTPTRPIHQPHAHHWHEWEHDPSGSSITHDSEDDDESEEDDDEDMGSFIDDEEHGDDEEDGSGTDHSTVVGDRSYMDQNDRGARTDASASLDGEVLQNPEDDSSEDDGEDEEPVRRPVTNGLRRRLQGPYARPGGPGVRAPIARGFRVPRSIGPDRVSRGIPTTMQAGTSANNAISLEDQSDDEMPVSAARRRVHARQMRAQ